MKKTLLAILVVLTLAGQLCAQTPPTIGPANIANTLYASNFAGWTVAQGQNGPFSWSSAAICTSATSGGVTFKPFVVGSPIRIYDTASPSNSENVTVTAISIIGSGCSITTTTPAYTHYSFFLGTATAGLQEAINYSKQSFGTQDPASLVITTPGWSIAGGTTGMITGALGSATISVLDERQSCPVAYVWGGSSYSGTNLCGGGGGNPCTDLAQSVQYNNGGAFGCTPLAYDPVSGDFYDNNSFYAWSGGEDGFEFCADPAAPTSGRCPPSGGGTISLFAGAALTLQSQTAVEVKSVNNNVNIEAEEGNIWLDGTLRLGAGGVPFTTTPFNVGANCFTVCLFDATAGAITADLPPANSAASEGITYYFIKSDPTSAAVTIVPNGIETINGAANYQLTAQYQYVILQAIEDPGGGFTGGWYVIGSGPSSGGGGFPIILGSTSIAASSTTTAVTGLSVNGVTLTTGDASTAYLNGAGAYTTPAGGGTIATTPLVLKGDNAGNAIASSIANPTCGGCAGGIQLPQGTLSADIANNVSIFAPTSVQSGGYRIVLPGNQPSGSDTYFSCTAADPAVCTWSAGGSLPTAATSGQIITSTAPGTTYAVQPQVFYSASGDTIASIEAECGSLCTYHVTLPQTITLAGNHSLSANVQVAFDAGGKWTINGAFTFTFQNQVTGTRNLHLAGSSTIVGLRGAVPPEWFGAKPDGSTDSAPAIGLTETALALNCGYVSLGAGNYLINSTLTFSAPCVGMLGSLAGYSAVNTIPQVATLITSNSATLDMIDVGSNPGTAGALEFGRFQLIRTVVPTGTTTAGMNVDGVDQIYVHDVGARDSTVILRVHNSVNGIYERIQGSWGTGSIPLTSYTSGQLLRGVYLDSQDGTPSPSVTFRDIVMTVSATGSLAGTARCLDTEGVSTRDNVWNNSYSAQCTYGRYTAYTGSTTQNAPDIHYIMDTHDGCTLTCVYLTGFSIPTGNPEKGVDIDGLYASGGSGPNPAVDIENSTGISIRGAVNIGSNGLAIKLNNDAAISLGPGCLVSSAAYPLTLINVTGSTIGCNYTGLISLPASTIMSVTTSTGNTFLPMAFNGYAGTGVQTNDVGSETENNWGGIIMSPNITTPYNLASTLTAIDIRQQAIAGGYVGFDENAAQGVCMHQAATQSGSHLFWQCQSPAGQFTLWDLTIGLGNYESWTRNFSGTNQNALMVPNYGVLGIFSGPLVASSNDVPDVFFDRDPSVPGQIDVGHTFPAPGTSPEGVADGSMAMAKIVINGGSSRVYICTGGTFTGLLATSSGACTGGSGTATNLYIQ